MLTVQRITSRTEFEQLATEWNAVLRDSAANTIALTHEWLLTWWDVFGQERELCVIVVRDDEQMIGLAPLLSRRLMVCGIPCCRVEFLASGEDAADEICSEYLDFILKKGHEATALRAILEFLRQEFTAWDEVLLKEIPDTSPTVELLQEWSKTDELRCEIEELGEALFLPLPDTCELFVLQLKRKLRHHLRSDEISAAEQGVVLRVIGETGHFVAAFDDLIKLHQERWVQRGQPGVFASEFFTRFHRQLSQRLPVGQVRFFVLQAPDRPLAALYAFVYDGRVFYYQSGFSSDCGLRSPGTLLCSLAIQHSITAGVCEWDFLKTEPNSYKYRWNPQTRRVVQVKIAKNHAKGLVLNTVQQLGDGLRLVKRALKR